MKVEKGKKVMTVNGAVGDVVEDFQGNKYLITYVSPTHGLCTNTYRAIDLDGWNTNVCLYDRYLVANYGKINSSMLK